jgi:branched-chain amino acid transport system permease protein
MTTFLQNVVTALVQGSLFGLIALGYTMVYGIVQLINFAHGEVFMVGSFAGLTVLNILPDSVRGNAIISVPLALIAAVMVSVTVAVLMERLAYRPLRRAPKLAPLITAIGVSLFLQEVVRLFYPGAKSSVAFDSPITGAITVSGVTIQYVGILILLTAVSLMLALTTFIGRSRTGRAMRATSQDPDTTALMGININSTIVMTFALGGALAAVAGVFQGMLIGSIEPIMGFKAGLVAFTAAVLGGIGNVTGAVLGGYLIGFIYTFATAYVPNGSAWQEAWAFLVLVVLLVVRPSGLLGEEIRERA